MGLIAVSGDTFEAEVLNASEPVVVHFWTEWGGPACRGVALALEEISSELVDQVKIVKFNADENHKIPRQYGVRGIPTLLLFKGGQVAAQQVGALPKSQLKAWIIAAL